MNGFSAKVNKQVDFFPLLHEWFKHLSMIFLFGLVAFLIVWLKSRTIPEFLENPVVVIYAIFITIFVFFRLSAAALYKHNYDKITQYQQSVAYEPFVSFIIPCKNEENIIDRTISHCFAIDYPKEKFEVIVINDGSTDNTGLELKSLQKRFDQLVVIEWQNNQGKRNAMAEGFKKAKGEIVIQLDSDSYIEARSFRNILLPFKNPTIGAVCAHTSPENDRENFLTKMQAAYYFVSFRILKAAESTFFSVFCCSGCSSAYRKSVVLSILEEWKQEKFLGKPVTWGDDRSLTSWILKTKYKTIYSDQVQAYTVVPTSFRQLLKQQLRWKKSWIINSIITGRFIYKQQPFIAFSYFFPLFLISFLTPFITLWATIATPLANHTPPFFYLAGIFSITSLFVIFCQLINKQNKYWPYLFAWAFLNIIFLSYITFYALFRLNDRGWGTR